MRLPTAVIATVLLAAPCASAGESAGDPAPEDEREVEEFEYSIGRGGWYKAGPEKDPTVRGRVRFYFGALSACWRSSGIRLRSLRGLDAYGVPIAGAGTQDPAHRQSWALDSETLDFARAEAMAHRCGFHAGFGLSAGMARQRIGQKIGSGSYLRGDLDPPAEDSALAGWGFEIGGRFEIAHCNPLAIINFLGFWKDLISGTESRRSRPSGLESFGIKLGAIGAVVFGIEAGFAYMRLPLDRESLLCRTVGGSWRTTTYNAGVFAGLHLGDAAVFKAGVEYVETGVRAYLNTRGADPESWRIRATEYSTGGFFELMIFLLGTIGLDLRAGSAGHGYCSASLSVSI